MTQEQALQVELGFPSANLGGKQQSRVPLLRNQRHSFLVERDKRFAAEPAAFVGGQSVGEVSTVFQCHEFSVHHWTIDYDIGCVEQCDKRVVYGGPLQLTRLNTEMPQYVFAESHLSPRCQSSGDRVVGGGESWRRDRDSNPGYVAVYTLSKRAPSATRPSLPRFQSIYAPSPTSLSS